MALEEITAATIFEESWNPLRKSKISAATTNTTKRSISFKDFPAAFRG
jgi:hypothetical protein